jgi:hypothetical protein
MAVPTSVLFPDARAGRVPRCWWLALVLIGACSLSAGGKDRCSVDRDCDPGRVCVKGGCVSPGAPPDAAALDGSGVGPADAGEPADAAAEAAEAGVSVADPGCKPPPAADGCAPGLAKCGAAACLVSLTSDTSNCGQCGHSCRGGECQGSQCQRIALATNQQVTSRRLLAIDADVLYWGTLDGKVMSLPLGGAAEPTTLATGQGSVMGIVVDEEFAYIMAEAGPCTMGWCLRRIPLHPGTAPITTLVDIGTLSGGLARDANALYWFDSGGSIMRLATHGSGLPTAQALAIDQGEPTRSIALDDAYVYWGSRKSNEGIVKRTRLDRSSIAPEHVAAGLQHPNGVAVDRWNVYWTDTEGRAVQMAPKQGGPVTTLAAQERAPVEIGLDDLNVYWGAEGGDPGMRKVSRCGGDARQAADGDAVGGIVVWKGNVYWNDVLTGLFRVAQ